MRRGGAGAQGVRGAAVMLALLLGAGARLSAQALDTIPKPVPRVVHIGKWVALAGAATLGALAHDRSTAADASYDELRRRCFNDPVTCFTGPDGRYLDPVSEGLYQDANRLDHQATRLLIGAEVTFAAAAVGFIWELTKPRGPTGNIPFEPSVEATPRATRLGLVVRF